MARPSSDQLKEFRVWSGEEVELERLGDWYVGLLAGWPVHLEQIPVRVVPVSSLNASVPPVDVEVGARARHLRALGMSDRAIAQALGASDKTVAKAILKSL